MRFPALRFAPAGNDGENRWQTFAPTSLASNRQTVLARLGTADGQGNQCRPRLQGGLGRRGVEDAGEQGPPVVNVSGPRYGAWHSQDRRVQGFNNIELITDRPLEINLRESSR